MYCVYKLTDKNNLVYYGSTKNPDQRLKKHKYGDTSCSNNLDKDSMKMSIMEYGIATKEDAVCLERYYFDNNVCVNFNKPILSEDERKGTGSEPISNIKPKSKALLKKIKETETVAEKKKRIIELNRKQKIAISKKGKKILTKDGHILV